MALCELTVKVHDSTSSRDARTKDGMCLSVQRPGIWIPPTEYDNWIRREVPPTGWDTLHRDIQGIFTGYRARVHEVVVAGTRRQPSIQVSYDRSMLLGLDTSFGFKDLVRFGMLRCDLTQSEIAYLTTVKEDARGRALEKRMCRIPYEVILSSGSRDDWRDMARRVEANRRSTPMTFAELQTQDY